MKDNITPPDFTISGYSMTSRRLGRRIRILLATIVLINFFPIISRVKAQTLLNDAPELRGIDVKEQLGRNIPLDLSFTSESGETVRLNECFQDGKPVVLTLAYYECPMLCTLVLNGISKAIKELDWVPGNEYQMLTISIDPEETPKLAKAKKDRYIQSLAKNDIHDGGWRFWVGNEKNIRQLADTVGFHYFYDQKQDEYAHPAVIFVLTDKGVISRYLYGIEHTAKDLRLALLEASEGKIGSVIDRVILFCYHYDPMGKKYAIMATNVMRLGGVATVACLGLFLGVLWLKEKTPTN